MNKGSLTESIHLRDHLRIIRKHAKPIMLCFLVTVATGAVVTHLQRPTYRATTKAMIERDAPRIMNFQESTPEVHELQTFLQTEIQIIKSRPVIQRTINNLGLLKRVPELAQEPDPIEAFLKSVTVEPAKQTRLIEIHVDDADPKLAADMANSLATAYVDHNLELRLAAAREAVAWLSSQVSDIRAKVSESEQQLQKYQEQAGLVAVDEKQSLAARNLAEANHAYLDAKAKRLEMETRLAEIRKAGRNPELLETAPVVINNPLIQRLKGQLVELELLQSKQLKTYTPRHPEALELQTQIGEIRQKIKEEVSRIVQSLESEYNALRARESAHLSTVAQYREEAQRYSQKEMQSGILKRDAGSNQQLYEMLLKRLKESGISQGLDIKSVRIVEPAIVPLKPVRPRKLFNLALAAVVGLGLGMFVAFFTEYMEDTIRTPEQVEQTLGVPVLALIPLMPSRKRS